MIEISKSVIQKDSKFLLLKRASHSKSYPDMWDFAGGKHDPGETPEEAAIRETKEETSYDIEPGIEIRTEEYHDKKHDLLFHYFTPKILSGDLTLSPDHSDFKWLSKKEMKSFELHPSVKLFIE
ncbi:MAG: NUDIX hydrolase [Nanoarchaeota archaeon]|nr:NUDIX hydrolase [Nanoarchaeota archaeon]